jgi:hypothetical protein
MVQQKRPADRERKHIHRTFTASLMSDTKWRKLFAALNESEPRLRQLIIKFVDSDREARIGLPGKAALQTPKGHIDTFEFGPISLRSIEWLELPTFAEFQRPSRGAGKLSARHVNQDIASAQKAIEALGRFQIEETKSGLRIIGHARPQAKAET